jgi:hypothetical protein
MMKRILFLFLLLPAYAFAQDQQLPEIDGKVSYEQIDYAVFTSDVTWTCEFTAQIDCRDNKSRIKIYDIYAHLASHATVEQVINENIEDLLANYKTLVSKSDSF